MEYCVFCFLDSDPKGTAPPRISQFLETVNNSYNSVVFKCKPTNPEVMIQTHPLSGSHTQGPIPCPNHPRDRYQMIQSSPSGPEPTDIIHTGQSKVCSPCLASPFLQKPQSPPPFASWPTPVLPCMAPCSPSFWDLGETNCVFTGNHLLVCWPHSASNFILTCCILKHLPSPSHLPSLALLTRLLLCRIPPWIARLTSPYLSGFSGVTNREDSLSFLTGHSRALSLLPVTAASSHARPTPTGGEV